MKKGVTFPFQLLEKAVLSWLLIIVGLVWSM